MKEIWKDIKDYEEYQISSFGNVRRKRGNDFIYIKLGKRGAQKNNNTSEKYLGVTLSQNGIRKGFAVHRLVAEAFVPNPNNLPYVNHINGLKNDNRMENLEWCTAEQNALHYLYSLGKRLHYGAINQYDIQGNFIKRYDTIREAALATSTIYGNIVYCAKGLRNIAGGYIWKFVNEDNGEVLYENKVKKEVVQLTLWGEYVKTFDSITDAAKEVNASPDSIAKCCTRSYAINKVSGYIWRFLDEYDKDEFSWLNGKTILESTVHDMPLKEYDNIKTLVQETNYDLIKIVNVINGLRKTAYRKKWTIIKK